MKPEIIRKKLNEMQDTDYRDFQKKLIPTVDEEKIIGIRTPELRSFARTVSREADTEEFLHDLPHQYFEENQLHAFLISLEKNYDRCLSLMECFLPYVDNWATCDQMAPKVFAKHRDTLASYALKWMESEHPYTVRYGIKVLMNHYLDEYYEEKYPEAVSRIRSDDYYVNMMRAWYFAEALAKQYDSAIRYLESGKMDIWTHNKTIQKAAESYRIPGDRKEILKKMKKTAG